MMKLIPFLISFLLLSSCWPSRVSFQDFSMPESWKTFSMQTLENRAANVPLSYPAALTEEIKTGVQNNSRLQLNPVTGKGDVVIEGIITSYSITPVALQEGDNSAKNRLTISVNFTIYTETDGKDDKMILTSTRFADYNSSSDMASVESSLLEEINAQIVQDVLNKLFSNW